MDKFVTKFKRERQSVGFSPSHHVQETQPSAVSMTSEPVEKKAHVEVKISESDIISDPALRKPILDYPVSIRDEVRTRYLVQGPCQPYEYSFPPRAFGPRKRSFLPVWFKKYEWLEYSVSSDAAFCFWCYLFSGANTEQNGRGAFTRKGFSNWKKAMEKFKEHIGSANNKHNYCRIQCENYWNQQQGLDLVVSIQSKEIEIAHRARLTPILRAIRFLLKQGLPFDGHDETVDPLGRGNFLALIDYTAKINPEVAKILNLNSPDNELTSPVIQKQIASACAAETLQIIIQDIGNKFFSLLVEEARNCSIKEQMSLVLRYVNDYGDVIERFVGVVHVTDPTAKSLKNAIDEFFSNNGLSISRLRGQGYDGASDMRDEFNELKVLILNENSSARYVHCFAHQIQLAVISTAEVNRHVSVWFYGLSIIVNVVGAPCKRKDAHSQKPYEHLVEKLAFGKCVSHYRTIIHLLCSWDSVTKVLNDICEHGIDTEHRCEASCMLDRMQSFDFVFIAYLMRDILGMINPLSTHLQLNNRHVGTTVSLIKSSKIRLQTDLRDEWDALLTEVVDFCQKYSIPVPNMEDKIPSRVRRKHDEEPITYLHRYRVEIFYQVIDLISQEMDNQFSETNMDLLIGVACLDPRDSFGNFDISRILHFAELFPEDFSADDQVELKRQLEVFIHTIQMTENEDFSNILDIGALAKKMLELKYDKPFNLIYLLLELALVLPIAAPKPKVERSFSTMKSIKSELRNKMGDEIHDDNLMCYVEYGIFTSIPDEAILRRFQKMQTEEIQLSSPNSSSQSSVNLN